MSTRMNQFRVTALAAALLSAFGVAFAEGPESTVSVGIGNWSKDRPQGGIFDGMRDSGTYLLLDGDVKKRDDATGIWWGLSTRNLGLDNREIKGEVLRQGDIGASFEYSRIPRDNQLMFNTGAAGIGTTTIRLPAVATVAGSGSNMELGTVRDRYTVKFFKNLAEGLTFNASFRNEEKDGTRLWGKGNAVDFAAEPISSTTRQAEATLTYARDRLQLSGGVYATSYTNDNGFVDIARISTTGVISSQNFLSLPPDSRSWEAFLNGGYNFTPTTRGSFKVSYSRATQNEQTPYVGVATGGAITGPRNLNGRLDTTLVEAGVTSKPTKDLSIVGNLRYRDFADKTPVSQYVTSATVSERMWNTPFSYKNTVGKLEATYRLPQSYSLMGGIEYNTQDRTVPNVGTLWVPFRSKLDETTYRVQLRKSMSETLNGTLAYAHSKRDGSSNTLPLQGGAQGATMDQINPLNLADRKRDKWRAMLDWSPMDNVNLQFSVEDSKDKYSGLPYGLNTGTGKLYNVDASYQISQDWSVNAWVSRDETTAKETTQRTVTVTRFNTLSEDGTSFGLGVRGTVMGKLKLGGDVQQFRSVNNYNQGISGETLAAAMLPVPKITNKMLRVKLFGSYPIQKNADLRFDLIYERWQTDDWSWTVFPVTGPVPFAYGDGTTVTANSRQNSTFAGVRYIYRFD